jgi:hypothetical protein
VDDQHLYQGYQIVLNLSQNRAGWSCSYRVTAVEKGAQGSWHGQVKTAYRTKEQAKQAALQQARDEIDHKRGNAEP